MLLSSLASTANCLVPGHFFSSIVSSLSNVFSGERPLDSLKSSIVTISFQSLKLSPLRTKRMALWRASLLITYRDVHSGPNTRAKPSFCTLCADASLDAVRYKMASIPIILVMAGRSRRVSPEIPYNHRSFFDPRDGCHCPTSPFSRQCASELIGSASILVAVCWSEDRDRARFENARLG